MSSDDANPRGHRRRPDGDGDSEYPSERVKRRETTRQILAQLTLVDDRHRVWRVLNTLPDEDDPDGRNEATGFVLVFAIDSNRPNVFNCVADMYTTSSDSAEPDAQNAYFVPRILSECDEKALQVAFADEESFTELRVIFENLVCDGLHDVAMDMIRAGYQVKQRDVTRGVYSHIVEEASRALYGNEPMDEETESNALVFIERLCAENADVPPGLANLIIYSCAAPIQLDPIRVPQERLDRIREILEYALQRGDVHPHEEKNNEVLAVSPMDWERWVDTPAFKKKFLDHRAISAVRMMKSALRFALGIPDGASLVAEGAFRLWTKLAAEGRLNLTRVWYRNLEASDPSYLFLELMNMGEHYGLPESQVIRLQAYYMSLSGLKFEDPWYARMMSIEWRQFPGILNRHEEIKREWRRMDNDRVNELVLAMRTPSGRAPHTMHQRIGQRFDESIIHSRVAEFLGHSETRTERERDEMRQ